MRRVAVLLVSLASVAASGDPVPAPGAASRLGLQLQRDQPIQISADELEAVRDAAGAERIVFRRSVEVKQADMRIRSDWLQATYASGSGRPERIHASGSVRISQQDTTVSCDEAVYESARCTLVCTDPHARAELRRGDDLLYGREIHFDLCSGVLRVRGGARIEVKARPAKEAQVSGAPESGERR